jgi:GNAT superfamily N-acetyltransferase
MDYSFSALPITAVETQRLRHVILWPHKSAPEECTIDVDDADHAHHVGAFDAAGRHVGVCSLFDQRSERFPDAIPTQDPVYRLRVMGTLPEVRGKGAGAAIVEYACDWAREQGARWLWCDAREVAFPFYLRMGFEFCSEGYEIDPIGPHRMMRRKL